ncbi:MAG TPA: DnaJ family domain-containing protein [Acidimicrobiia bacterium]
MESDHSSRPWSLAERLIEEAIAAGEFEDLPGAGRPLPGAGVTDDELWWVRAWLKRNRTDLADEGPMGVQEAR